MVLVRPTGRNILIRPLPPKEEWADRGGLLIKPSTIKMNHGAGSGELEMRRGVVLEVGPGDNSWDKREKRWVRRPVTDVKKGDTVIYYAEGATMANMDGDVLIKCESASVPGVVTE